MGLALRFFVCDRPAERVATGARGGGHGLPARPACQAHTHRQPVRRTADRDESAFHFECPLIHDGCSGALFPVRVLVRIRAGCGRHRTGSSTQQPRPGVAGRRHALWRIGWHDSTDGLVCAAGWRGRAVPLARSQQENAVGSVCLWSRRTGLHCGRCPLVQQSTVRNPHSFAGPHGVRHCRPHFRDSHDGRGSAQRDGADVFLPTCCPQAVAS